MFAVVINVLAIFAGCSIGLLLRKGIPEMMSDALMKGLGLCTVVIGIQGAIKEQDILLLILSAILGIFIGEGLDLDGKVNRSVEGLLAVFKQQGDSAKIAQAFVVFPRGIAAGDIRAGVCGGVVPENDFPILEGLVINAVNGLA